MASSAYAFFHCHYAFQKFPFFCVTLCVLHALQNATLSHSAEHATNFCQYFFFFDFFNFCWVFQKFPFFLCHPVLRSLHFDICVLLWSVTGFSLRQPLFDPTTAHMGFVGENATFEELPLEYPAFPCQLLSPMPHMHLHISTTNVMQFRHEQLQTIYKRQDA